LNPDVTLISEPWSSRGNHKTKLSGSSWAAWNDAFRDSVRQFSRGGGDRDRLRRGIEGSVREWTATPMQSINYLESHDDKSLADELTANPDHDGRDLTERDAETHRLAATLLLTSLGIPMIAEGQAFARSKHGIHNTFDQGDAINAIRWTDNERPLAAELVAYYRDLIALRAGEDGTSLRIADRPAEDYVVFLTPPSEQQFGYIINGRGRRTGAGFLVLLNASRAAHDFEVSLPPGQWSRVGDGRRVDLDDTARLSTVEGGGLCRVTVPARTAHVYRTRFRN